MSKGNNGNVATVKQSAQPAGEDSSKADSSNKFVSVTDKRLRALRKKHRHAEELRAAKASGKTLEASEEAVLLSLPALEVSVQEVEKLRTQLLEALAEEETERQAQVAAHASAVQELQAQLAARDAELSAAHQSFATERAARLAAQHTVPMVEASVAAAQAAAAAAAASQAATVAAKATADSEWSNKLGMLMRLHHLNHLVSESNPMSQFNHEIIVEHFGGSVSASDLAALRALTALLNGSSSTYGDDLPPFVFESSTRHLNNFFNSAEDDVAPGVSFRRLAQIVADSVALLSHAEEASQEAVSEEKSVSTQDALTKSSSPARAPRDKKNKHSSQKKEKASRATPPPSESVEATPSAEAVAPIAEAPAPQKQEQSQQKRNQKKAQAAVVAAPAEAVPAVPAAPAAASVPAQSPASAPAVAATQSAQSKQRGQRQDKQEKSEKQEKQEKGQKGGAARGGRGGKSQEYSGPVNVAVAPSAAPVSLPNAAAAPRPAQAQTQQQKASFANMVANFAKTGSGSQ